MSITAGSKLGPYEILAPIGAGGMGEVWRARDTRLNRSVAVKVLPAELANSAQLKLRFEREAKTISQLNHPNICQIYDVGDDYLVMELVEGESLADRIGRGPLPLDQVLRYAVEIADALDRAHRHGIIHRDLKPGNIMVAKSGAKLLDFGLAAVVPSAGAPDAVTAGATQQKPLTQEGTIVGTFQYMAPEQLEGLQADARTDIFAFGCVLYEMITGRRAFDGKNRTSVIAAIVSGTPRAINDLQPLTPPALEHLVRRCLAKDPDDRWQSAHDIAEDLRWIRDAGSQAGVAAAVSQRRKTRSRLGAVAAVAAMAAAAAVAAYYATHRAKPLNVHFTLPGITNEYFAAVGVRISPDGSSILINATDRKTSRSKIFVRRFDEFDARPVDGTEGVTTMCWSPDGRSIAYVTLGQIHRVDLTGGSQRVLAATEEAAGIAWNGDWIYWGVNEGPLRRVPANGGTVETLTRPDVAKHELGHEFPYFLPGGKRMLFISYTRDVQSPDRAHTLYATSPDGKNVQRIGPISSRVEYFDGRLFFVRDATLYAAPFDESALRFTGDPKPVIDDVNYFQPIGGASFDVSSEGMIATVAFARPDRAGIFDMTGRELLPILDNELLSDRMSVSPDGTKIYLARFDPKIGTSDLWAYGLTRPTRTQITFDPDEEAVPVVSPDGKHLYYESDRLSVPDIYEKTVDSAAVPDRAVVAAPGYQEPTSISADGRFLLFTSNQTDASTYDIWLQPLTGGLKARPLIATPAREINGAFSPNGQWISYTSDASGAAEVYVRPFPDGPSTQITTLGGVTTTTRWSPDGTKIYFAKDKTMYEVALARNGEAGDPHGLFVAADPILTFDVLPDGKRFALAQSSDSGGSPPIRVISRWSADQ